MNLVLKLGDSSKDFKKLVCFFFFQLVLGFMKIRLEARLKLLEGVCGLIERCVVCSVKKG